MSSASVRVALAGCGSMSRAWLQTAVTHPQIEIVALTDLNPEAAKTRAAEHDLPASVVFPSLTEALRETRPDAVFDVTIPDAHCAVTIEALEAGCHVLGEKPMATSLADARRMVETAKRADRIYAVIQNRRYEPNIQRARQTLAGGALGAVEEIHCDFYIGAHFGGFRDEMDFPLILDMAIHTFDAARFLGQVDPVSVYCHSFNPGRSWYRGDASAVAIFEMTDGVVYSYRGSWCAEGLSTSWNSDWRVVCRQGMLRWNGDADIEAQRVKPEGDHKFFSEMEPVTVPDLTVEHVGHAGLIHEFIDCVQRGATPQTVCTDNVKSLAMVLAAVESARTGRRTPVTW